MSSPEFGRDGETIARWEQFRQGLLGIEAGVSPTVTKEVASFAHFFGARVGPLALTESAALVDAIEDAIADLRDGKDFANDGPIVLPDKDGTKLHNFAIGQPDKFDQLYQQSAEVVRLALGDSDAGFTRAVFLEMTEAGFFSEPQVES